MPNFPTSLRGAPAAFTDTYSPRIGGRVNNYDVKIAHFRGEHPWHVHENTDEFFLLLDSRVDIALREGDVERTVTLHAR